MSKRKVTIAKRATASSIAVPRIRFKGCEGEWCERGLSEVFQIRRGLTYRPCDVVKKDGVRVLRSSNISGDAFVLSDEDVFVTSLSVNIPYIKNGDVLITAANGSLNLVGKHAVVRGLKENSAVHGGFMLAGMSNEPEFVNAWLSAPWFRDFSKLYVGGGNGTIGNLSKKGFDSFSALLPEEIEERSLIANVFRNLDESISLINLRMIQLRQLKQSMLVKMFPQRGKTIPEIRFSGFKDEWIEKKLSELSERVTRKNTELQSDLPLTISAEQGLIDQREIFTNRIAAKNVSNYYLVRRGEFAYNRSTSEGHPWGVVKRLDKYEMGVLSTLYMVFSLNEDSVDSEYLVHYYSTVLWHSDVARCAAEGARNHGLLNVSVEDFFSTHVLLPRSVAEQQKIGAFFKNLDSLIAAAEKRVAKLRQVKASLLERMFV